MSWLSIALSKINIRIQTYCTPTKDIIQESFLFLNINFREFKVSLFVIDSEVFETELRESNGFGAQFDMSTVFAILVHGNDDITFLFFIQSSQCIRVCQYLLKFVGFIMILLALGLIGHLVVISLAFTKSEEYWVLVFSTIEFKVHGDLSTSELLFLFSCVDDDFSYLWLAREMFDFGLQCLFLITQDVCDFEVKLTNIVLSLEIFDLSCIITII